MEVASQWAKSPKKQSEGVYFILSAELTKTHSFRLLFGDFAHWVSFANLVSQIEA